MSLGRRGSGVSLSILVLAVLAVAVAAAALAPTAHAHATFVRSDPVDGASLAQSPSAIRLWFSEPVQPGLSSVRLADSRQRAVSGLRLSTGAEGLLTVELPELRRGAYALDWRVLSDDDVHVTSGTLVFAVRASAPPASSPAGSPSAKPGEVVLRWLGLIFLAVAVGALTVVAFVLRPTPHDGWSSTEEALGARRRVLWLAGLSALHAVALGPVVLYWEATQAVGSLPGSSLLDAGGRLLADTRWGTLWLVREACLVALAIVVFLGLRARPLTGRVMAAIAVPLVLALALTYALTSHAAGLEDDRAPAVIADAVHVLAASVWIGGLLALVVACLRPIGVRSPLGKSFLRSFGWLAAVSIVLLTATGLYAVSRQVASVDALLRSLYGQTLLAKTGLLLAAGALGFVTWLLVHPVPSNVVARVLGRPPGSIRPRRFVLVLEATLGMMILLGAALVTASPPARGPEYLRVEPAPSSLTKEASDLLVSISVKPNLPGPNVVTVRTAFLRRPALAGIDGVSLQLGPQPGGPTSEVVAARRVGEGVYRTTVNGLAREGPLRIATVVRRPGLDDTVARFDWSVGSSTPPRRVLVSDRSLEPLLARAVGAIVLALVVVIAAFALLRRPRARAARLQVSGSRR